MTTNKTGPLHLCDPVIRNLFLDNELGPEEHEQMKAHVSQCPICRQAVAEYETVNRVFKRVLAKEASEVGFEEMNTTAMARAFGDRRNFWARFTGPPVMKKLYFSLATAALLVFIVTYSFISENTVTPGPSAIVNSIDGTMSSVIILETEELHKTVIWFNEPS